MKNIKKIIITGVLTMAAMLLNFNGADTVNAEMPYISFCSHGDKGYCVEHSSGVGFTCDYIIPYDCGGSWSM